MSEKSQKILRAFVAVVLGLCAVFMSVWTVVTEKADVNLVVSAGKTDAVARVTQFKTYSKGVSQGSFQNYVSEFGGVFGSYGTATFRDNVLSLNRLRVEDRVDFVIDFSDKSDVEMQYRVVLECKSDYYGLYEGLEISISSNSISKTTYACSYEGESPKNVESDWVALASGKKTDKIYVSVKLPIDNAEYSGYGTQISVAVQVIPLIES